MKAIVLCLLLLIGCQYDPTSVVTPCDKERMNNGGRQDKRRTPNACDEWLDKQSTATQEQYKRMRPVKPGPPPDPPKRRRPLKPHEVRS